MVIYSLHFATLLHLFLSHTWKNEFAFKHKFSTGNLCYLHICSHTLYLFIHNRSVTAESGWGVKSLRSLKVNDSSSILRFNGTHEGHQAGSERNYRMKTLTESQWIWTTYSNPPRDLLVVVFRYNVLNNHAFLRASMSPNVASYTWTSFKCGQKRIKEFRRWS